MIQNLLYAFVFIEIDVCFRTKITKDHISAMFKAYVPQSFVEGYYRGEGRFNNLKIKSKGYFNVTASKLQPQMVRDSECVLLIIYFC